VTIDEAIDGAKWIERVVAKNSHAALVVDKSVGPEKHTLLFLNGEGRSRMVPFCGGSDPSVQLRQTGWMAVNEGAVAQSVWDVLGVSPE